jgi:hypothetical protein
VAPQRVHRRNRPVSWERSTKACYHTFLTGGHAEIPVLVQLFRGDRVARVNEGGQERWAVAAVPPNLSGGADSLLIQLGGVEIIARLMTDEECRERGLAGPDDWAELSTEHSLSLAGTVIQSFRRSGLQPGVLVALADFLDDD